MSIKSMLLILVTGLSAFATPGMAQAPKALADDTASCAALKQVVTHTKNDFSTIRGKSSGADEWAPRIAIPGQESCVILKTKTISYVCESRRVESQEDADTLAAASLERARACLGKLWVPQTMFSDSFIALNDDENSRTVMFAVETDPPLGQYYVRTRIARMMQNPLEPPARTAEEAAPKGYCPDLTRIVESGRSNFASLIANAERHVMGPRVHWQSSIQLAGFEDCWVHEEVGKPRCRYLSCSTGPLTDLVDAETLRDKVAAEAKACLGSQWKVGRSRQSDGTLQMRVVGDRADPYIDLAPSKSLYSRAYTLKLDVMLDLQGCY